MKNNKSLLATNKYLRNPKLRQALIVDHAAASARIEGVKDAKQRAQRLSKKSASSRPA